MNHNFVNTVLTLTILLGAAFVAVDIAAKQPNIVVILTDDQGYADISLNPQHLISHRKAKP